MLLNAADFSPSYWQQQPRPMLAARLPLAVPHTRPECLVVAAENIIQALPALPVGDGAHD